MQFTVPFRPQSAQRPRYSNVNGKTNRMFMPKEYRQWRDETNLWFEDWLYKTDYKLLKECLYLPSGENIRNTETMEYSRNFYGYEIKVMFVLPHPKNNRPFPIAQQSSDIDNYAKALVDMIFESESFKNAKLNDKFIQSMILLKRNAIKGEESRIEVDLHQITI